MLKRLHLFLAALLLAGVATAQNLNLNLSGPRVLKDFAPGQRTSKMCYEQSPRFARYKAPQVPIAGNDEQEQMWWGYFEGDVAGCVGFGGSSETETYWIAIGITNKLTLAQGNSITGIRFAVSGAAYLSNVHVWIANSLPSSLAEVLVDVPVDASKLNDDAWTEVALPEPFAVPNKTFYVGYTCEVAGTDDSLYPVLLRYNGANQDNSFWVRTSGLAPSWNDSFKQYGPVAVQVFLEGENFPKNSVDVSKSFNDVFALPDGSAEAVLTLTNCGTNKVTSIDYCIDLPNSYTDDIHMEIEGLEGLNDTKEIRIPVPADSKPGRTTRAITITKVNGEDNGIEEAYSDGYCVTLSRAVERRTVVEEFTGTWCGWCPRGTVGLELINQQFGEKAITIAVHDSDPMEIDYGVGSGAGYPSAYVDRAIVADPYFGVNGENRGICDLVAESNKVLAEASVDLQAPVLNKSGNVTFKTDVCFNYTSKEVHYALGYVIVADGLTGTGRKWLQSNFYCNPEIKEEWEEVTDLADYLNGDPYIPQTYNHVAIAAKGMDGGIEKSIKSVSDGDTLTVTGTVALTGNTVLQSFDNLKVVSVLFNTTTGTIVNADIQPVTVSEEFAVNKAQIQAFKTMGAIKGTTAQVPVPMANFGRAGIHSIDYTVRVSGQTSDTLRLELKKPITTLGVYEDVQFPIEMPEASGVYTYSISLCAVNGEKNEATTGKLSNGSINVIAKASKRKTVVEEFTGTWCMWCPRGAAGLKRIRAEYPDDAVVMAIHGGNSSEPMQVSAFNNQMNSISGFPSAHVNRYRTTDPYMGDTGEGFGMADVLAEENSEMVEASVSLQQPIWDLKTDYITFTTDVTFQLNRRSAPYLLSYVLVADGLKGEGDDWLQTNAYAAYYYGAYDDDPYMKEICNDWDVYANVSYNDVAVAGLGIDTGVAGSLKTAVDEGQTQSHSSKIGIKTNNLAKQATKLRLIAMLYDKTRKVFINADEKVVITSDQNPVRDLNSAADAQVRERYSLDGKRLTAPARGLNLVRMSDGSVRKQLSR
ncbi:MAG: hypothetical protein J5545_07225 [Bacteroidaceae bacterium]|nr:hypothetical protein [Bacteroidaceae bacterium]